MTKFKSYVLTKNNQWQAKFILCFCFLTLFFSTSHAPEKKLNIITDSILDLEYLYESKGEYRKAIQLVNSHLPNIPQDSLQQLGGCYSAIFCCYFRLGDLENALIYAQKCLEIDEKLYDKGDITGLSSSLGNLASIYIQMNKTDEAENFLLRAITIDSAQVEAGNIEAKTKLAIRKAMLGEAYCKAKRLTEALQLTQEALELDKQTGNRYKIGVRLSQIGAIYLANKDYSKAEKTLNEALQIEQDNGNLPSQNITLLQLGQIYRLQKKFATAEKVLLECVNNCQRIEQKSIEHNAWRELCNLYKDFNMYKDALHAVSKYEILNDSINTEKLRNELEKQRIVYESENQQLQIASQQTTIKWQRRLFLLLLFMLSGCTIFIALLKRSQRRQKKLITDLQEMINMRNVIFHAADADNKKPASEIHLTTREKEVLNACCNSMQNKEIANQLGITIKSVEKIKRSLFEKLNVSTTTELVIFAFRNNLIGNSESTSKVQD